MTSCPVRTVEHPNWITYKLVGDNRGPIVEVLKERYLRQPHRSVYKPMTLRRTWFRYEIDQVMVSRRTGEVIAFFGYRLDKKGNVISNNKPLPIYAHSKVRSL